MKLELRNIHKSFDGKEVLHGVSFAIEKGKALGLLGRNGAGKTTSIRILMDVFKASEGEVLMDGKPFERKNYRIGYMPEERGLYPKKKVIEQLVYFGELRGISRKEAKKQAKALLVKLQIEEYENRKLETLSKGNQQKVQLAETLMADPDIIILDEPFSGLDPVNSQLLKDLIREKINSNKLVIFSSHQMSYVEEFCEDIAIVNQGNIVLEGKLSEIQKEWGNKKLMLRLENKSREEMKTIVKHHLATLVDVTDDRHKDYIVLKLLDGVTKQDLFLKFSALAYEVAVFCDYVPSLNDIFVQKVGDENEAV
ncbi:MAG: ABC transporter ATP-binding protein [Breznakia sp.]